VIRKLRQSETTFQKIRDEIYANKSAQHVLDSDVSANGVSELLGFTEPANFRRSFKRWFKMKPQEYRDLHNTK